MNGICKLCCQEKELCKQSHIIPNFMYKSLFDDNNRMHAIQTERGKIKLQGSRQTGEFEKHILCQPCDNETIGKLDRYASLVLYEGYPKKIERRTDPDGTEYTYCAGLDYTQFKLFLLSILWRSSISDRSLFKEVSLGLHEDSIRQMLLSGDPGEQLKYPCLIMTYLNLEQFPDDVVAQPSLSKVNGGFVYKFLISGMIYIFFVSKYIIPDGLKECAINRNGELKIIHMLPQVAKNALSDMLGLKHR